MTKLMVYVNLCPVVGGGGDGGGPGQESGATKTKRKREAKKRREKERRRDEERKKKKRNTQKREMSTAMKKMLQLKNESFELLPTFLSSPSFSSSTFINFCARPHITFYSFLLAA